MRAWLVRLYPAAWRARYGEEFLSLLQERAVGPFDVLDIIFAAFDAHRHFRGLDARTTQRKGIRMTLRLGGAAAVLGGLVSIVGLAWMIADSSDQGYDPGVTMFVVGLVGLLVGMAGLSAFQARAHPVLMWIAFGFPAAGVFVLVVALIGSFRGDDVWAGFLLGLAAIVIGSALFAIATWRTRALPRSGALILGIAAAVSVAGFVGASVIGGWIGELFVLGLVACPVAWVVVGLQAIRLDKQPASLTPA